jgi:hypothetical protein
MYFWQKWGPHLAKQRTSRKKSNRRDTHIKKNTFNPNGTCKIILLIVCSSKTYSWKSKYFPLINSIQNVALLVYLHSIIFGIIHRLFYALPICFWCWKCFRNFSKQLISYFACLHFLNIFLQLSPFDILM